MQDIVRMTRTVVVVSCAIMISASVVAQFDPLTSASQAQDRLRSDMPAVDRMKIIYDLAYYYIAKPGEDKVDLDSALDLLARTRPLVGQLNDPASSGKFYLLESKGLRERGDSKNGKMNLEKAQQALAGHHLSELEGDVLRDLNQYYPCDKTEDAVVKLPILQRMTALYEMGGAEEKQAEGLIMQGDLYQIMQEYSQGVVVLNKAVAVYQSIHHEGVHVAYDLLGSCYLHIGDVDKAVRYGLLAIQTAQRVKDSGMNVTLYNRLGVAFLAANMLPEANLYFTKALERATRLGVIPDMILTATNRADVYLSQHRPAAALQQLTWIETRLGYGNAENESDIYGVKAKALTDLGRYAEAWGYINKMIVADSIIGDNIGHYRVATHYCLATKNYRKLALYADSLEMMDKIKNTKRFSGLAHLLRFKADSAQGELIGAVREYQLYKQSEDRVLDEKNKKEINLLNIMYETDKKDNAIRTNQLEIITLQKEDKLKTEEIRSTRLNRNIIIAGTCMLLLLLALIYNQYRIKQKSNRELLTKQKEINAQNMELQQLVDDKEWLMKEIHHRVKNNLQLVMSLLNTQSDTAENAESFAAVNEVRQRIFSMSLVHQKLYQAGQLSVVDMYTYIPDLVDYVKESFANGERVRFTLNIDHIELDTAQATSVGLILNELLTNSFKHAFSEVTRGLISIRMHAEDDGGICLWVKDNGTGLPLHLAADDTTTMGMQLIRTLSQQLRGTIAFTNEQGLIAQLRFWKKTIQK